MLQPEQHEIGEKNMNTINQEILTVEDVSQLLHCDTTTVEDKARNGELPGVKIGRSWIFPRDALIDSINELARLEAAARKAGKQAGSIQAVVQPSTSKSRRQPPKLPDLAA